MLVDAGDLSSLSGKKLAAARLVVPDNVQRPLDGRRKAAAVFLTSPIKPGEPC